MTDEDGIKMIIHLQNMTGKVETKEEAKKGWNSMNETERAKTEMFYNMFKTKENPHNENN